MENGLNGVLGHRALKLVAWQLKVEEEFAEIQLRHTEVNSFNTHISDSIILKILLLFFSGRTCVGTDRIEMYCTNLPPCPELKKLPIDGGWSAFGKFHSIFDWMQSIRTLLLYINYFFV